MSETDDIFAAFRTPEGEAKPKPPRNTGGPVFEPEVTGEEDEPYILPPLRPEKYQAFRLGKRRERLLIARATQPFRFPFYHELKDISFDQDFQQACYLYFHAMTVELSGKNLWPVVHAIASGRCDAIYEYHSKLYPAVPAKDEPLITSIKIAPPASLAESEDG